MLTWNEWALLASERSVCCEIAYYSLIHSLAQKHMGLPPGCAQALEQMDLPLALGEQDRALEESTLTERGSVPWALHGLSLPWGLGWRSVLRGCYPGTGSSREDHLLARGATSIGGIASPMAAGQKCTHCTFQG